MLDVAITADDYQLFTGSLAPADFDKSVMLAQQIIDAHTLYAYVGRDMTAMSNRIQITYKQAIAMQTMAISQRGGVAGSTEENYSSVTIGQFSMAGRSTSTTEAETQKNDELLSPAAKALLPLLISYGRGLRNWPQQFPHIC